MHMKQNAGKEKQQQLKSQSKKNGIETVKKQQKNKKKYIYAYIYIYNKVN